MCHGNSLKHINLDIQQLFKLSFVIWESAYGKHWNKSFLHAISFLINSNKKNQKTRKEAVKIEVKGEE